MSDIKTVRFDDQTMDLLTVIACALRALAYLSLEQRDHEREPGNPHNVRWGNKALAELGEEL